MYLTDKLTIDASRRTADGYLTVSAKIAKAGNVQLYSGAEVGRPDLATVRVYRPRDEVLNARPSFAHRPVTLGHPSESVTADNWAGLAKGWTGDEVSVDGDVIRVPMLLADGEAIRAIEAGTRQLSMGYDCQLDWTPGTSPTGEAYDAVQRGIRGNHVAIVPAARGGPDLTLGDSAMSTDARPATAIQMIDHTMIDAEAKKPEYDWCRGRLTADGTPMDKHYAMVNLMHASPEAQRAQATYDHMVHQQTHAWQRPVNDNAAPATLDAAAAHDAMVKDLGDAWKR